MVTCHTAPGSNPGCTRQATHVLVYSTPVMNEESDAATRHKDPVCEPCGQRFTRNGSFPAMLVRLHVYAPTPPTLIVNGHRLVDDAEFGQRCHDCGRTDSLEVFKMSMLNGCSARPESIDHLALTFADAMAPREDRALKSAQLWHTDAVEYTGLFIEDWRVVLDHPVTAAHFTFRDREYRVKFDLGGHRIAAEKLENRGRPAPVYLNREYAENYRQVVFHFHDLVTDSGSTSFATYTPGEEDVILYYPEGAIRAVLRVELDNTGTREWRLGVVTDAVCEAFGAIADIGYQVRVYK